ncbi:hypothetical protein N7449_001917 [Penicillium cf. viridicatum]|uniref:Uncharacterized protein n=1 Tax=Penicillium cf. viridicatum TaxID=2972119 RepID=A0A9W9N963_9EURO|nr:hypothetical protein N7449_001917 [Penicillium cf. viridicatum]
MERDRTVRDLFPALVVQLERETSETPSIESDDSVVAFVHESPTPRANTLLQDSDAPQGSDARFDIDPSTTTQHTSIHFLPQLTTDGHDSDGEPTSPVPPVPHLPLLPSNLESKASNPPASSPESPRQNTRSRWTTTQVPSTPVRSTRVRFTPVGGDSEEYLPTASHTVSSGDNRPVLLSPLTIVRALIQVLPMQRNVLRT